MADNVTVSWNAAYPVRSTEKSSQQVQHVLIDAGGTGAESVVSAANPLPVTTTATALPDDAATATNQSTQQTLAATANVLLTSIDGKITACDTGAIVGSVNIAAWNGTSFQYVRMDSSTRSFQTVDYAHHEIHAGSSFHCHYSNTCTNTNEMTIIAFNTPDSSKYIHIFPFFSSTAGATAYIYETADLDVDEGTQLTVWNRNRNSSTTSTIKSIETVPVANKATSFNEAQAAGATLSTASELWAKNLGAAAAGQDTAGESRDNEEWILKRNTQYAFVIKSTSDDDNIHDIELNWYEHSDEGA